MDGTVGILLLLGAVSIVAGIVGGNVKLPGGVEFPALARPVLRLTLCVVGGFFFLSALGIAQGAFDSAPTTTSSTTGQPSSSTTHDAAEPAADGAARVHFSEALVPACERATKAAAALGTPAKGDLQAVIAYYNGVGSILEDLSKSMRQVAPPAGDEAEVSGLINDLYQVGDAYGVVAGDLTSGERSVAEHDYGVTQGLINAYDARADAYGLDARCFAR